MPLERELDTDLTLIRSGSLSEQENAASLLLRLHREKSSGALRLRGTSGRREVVLRQGQVWGVRVDRLEIALPARLGCSEEQTRELLVELIERGTPVRQALARLLGDSKIDGRLKQVHHQRLSELLAWTEGEYSWLDGERHTEGAHDPVELLQAIADACESQGARAAQNLLRARRERPFERGEHYDAAKRGAASLFREGAAGALFESGAKSFFDLVARGLSPEVASWQLRALMLLGALRFVANAQGAREAPPRYVPRLLARAKDEADAGLRMTFARRAEEARKLLQEIAAKPRDLKPLSALRVLLREVEMWDGYVEVAAQELSLLEAGREKRPPALLYRELAGIFERSLYRGDEAARYLEAALSFESDEPSRARLRDLWLDAGEVERVLETDTTRTPQVAFSLARLLWERGQGLRYATQLVEEALRQRPNDPEMNEFLAAIEARDASPEVRSSAAKRIAKLAEAALSPAKREFEKARALVEKARAIDPDSPEVLELAEKVARARNDQEAAAEAMLDALAIIQEPRGRAELRRRLAALPLGPAFTQEHLEAQLNDSSTPEELRAEALTGLRTLLGRAGEQARYAFFLEDEAKRCQGTAREVPLVLELAQLYARALNDPARAVSSLEAPLLRDPEQPEITNALRSLGRQAGWSSVARLLAKSALEGTWKDPRDPGRIRRLEEAARMMEERVLDPARASALWRKFDEFDPGATAPREAIRRIEAKLALQQGLLATMEREAETQPDPLSRARALKKLAVTYHEQAHDAARAINAYARAWEIIPGDTEVISALEALYQDVQDWEGVARVLYHRLGNATDAKQRSELLWRYAQVCEERIERPDAAASALAEILVDTPDDPVALSRLERLYVRAKDYGSYLGTRARRASLAADASARASVYAEMAELCERLLGDRDRAAELWRWAHEAKPSDPRPRRALARLLRMLGRADELLALYKTWALEALAASPRRVCLLRHAARYAREAKLLLHERELLELLVQEDGEDGDALARLSTIALQAQDAALWFSTGERLLQARGVSASYEEQVRENTLQMAQSYEAGGNAGEALRLLRKLARSTGAGDLRVLSRLAQVETTTGDPAGAIWALERSLYKSAGSEQLGRAREICALWTKLPGEESARILALARVSTLRPEDPAPLKELSALYAAHGEWGRVLELLARRAALATSPQAQVDALCELARVEEEKLGDAEAALETLQRAYETHPGESFAPLREALLQRRLGRELVRLYRDAAGRTEDAAQAVSLLHEAARAERELNGDIENSLDLVREAFQDYPSVPATTEVLLHTLQEAGRFAEIVELYQTLAGFSAGPARVSNLLLAARTRGQKLSDAEGEIEILRSAYQEYPEDPRTLPALDAALRALSRWEELMGLYDARSVSKDEAIRRVAIERMVDLCRTQLQDPRRAFLIKRKVLRPDRRDDLALHELEELAMSAAAYDDLCSLYQALADHAQQNTWRVQMLRRKAHTREALQGDAAAALADIEQAFRVNPEDDELLAELGRLGDETADRGPLLSAYLLRRGAARSPQERMRYTLLAAEVAEMYQLDASAALSLYRDALSLGPSRRETWTALRRITRSLVEESPSEASRLWRGLADLLWNTAAGLDKETRVDLSLEVAEIQYQAGDMEGALSSLEATLTLHPNRNDTIARLESYAKSAGTLARAASALLREAELTESVTLTRTLLARAAKLREDAGDLLGSVEILRRLLSLGQQDALSTQAAASLEALLERAGRYEELIKHHETVAASLRAGPARRERLLTIARLWDERLHRPKEATATYQRLLQNQPNDAEAESALERLYEAQGEWRKLADLLERRAQQSPSEAPELYRRAGEIFAERLRLPRNAIACYESSLVGAPDDKDVLGALAQLYERQQRWMDAARTLLSIAQRTPGPEAAPILLRRADLLASRLKDLAGARGALEEALARHPNGDAEREIRSRLAQLRS